VYILYIFILKRDFNKIRKRAAFEGTAIEISESLCLYICFDPGIPDARGRTSAKLRGRFATKWNPPKFGTPQSEGLAAAPSFTLIQKATVGRYN